jgi:hypothetical protein
MKYWFCANIPPRPLVDLYNRAKKKKKREDQSEEEIFLFFFVWTGSIRFGPDWCDAVGMGLVRFGRLTYDECTGLRMHTGKLFYST